MRNLIDQAEVARHVTRESCWVVLYGNVWDVTDYLDKHPGGASIILKLAGKVATEKFDPVHPLGTLEENLPEEACLGAFNPKSSSAPIKPAVKTKSNSERNGPIPVAHMLSLDEIEAEATKKLSEKAWRYYYSASDDLVSKHLNATVYRQMLLRPQVFIDATDCDLTTMFLGFRLELPVYVSPAAMARLAHPDGEWGIAQACKSYGAMQIISNHASMTPEQIVKGAGSDQVFGWQLYAQTDVKKSEAMLARINKLDAIKFVCLTLDAPVPGKRELDEKNNQVVENEDNHQVMEIEKSKQVDEIDKSHVGDMSGKSLRSSGIGQALFAGTDPSLTWCKTLPWLKKHTSKPIVLKGIRTHEDAYIAAQHSPLVQGIILSNHGGRELDTAPPSVHTLLEIRKYCPKVLQKIEVIVDGGIKRGTDVVKALYLGAKAVGVGRAALFGLGAGGIQGVERVFDLLNAETATAMRLLGAQHIDQLGTVHV